ncbi:MAG: tetratricopeptide repeat protein [Terriglobales bacterium]
MQRPRGTFWKFSLLLITLVSYSYAGEAEWVEVRSPHFSVVTDTGEKRGREVALRFEQMRAVFGALLTKAKVNLPVPLQIVAFRDTKEMKQHVPLWKGKPGEVSGLFEGIDDRPFIMLDMSVDDPWQVVFHEYAHQLLNGNTRTQFQPWFDEGFAEFFSTIKINRKEAEIGLPPKNDVLVLRQASLPKVADLFRVQRDSSTYNESSDHRSLFYAQSWLVVHYLYDKRLTRKLDFFEMAVDEGVSVEDAIQRAFGLSASDFDKVLHQYLRSGRFASYSVPTQLLIDSSGFTAKPLTSLDATAVLANMDLYSPDYHDRAMEEFLQVLQAQPDNVAALRGLGYGYLLKKDFSHAEEYFRKAVMHDSHDPQTLYYSALMIEMQEGPGIGNDRQELEVIQKLLEKAVALDPEFADAYCRLAFTYVSQGKAEQALNTMVKAVTLNPRSLAYTLNLAQLYALNQRFDRAVALLRPLTKTGDPRFAAQAAQMLARVQRAAVASAAGTPAGVRSTLTGEQELILRETRAPSAPEKDSVVAASRKDPGQASFVKGRLLTVDCLTKPAALLTVIVGDKTWRFYARDGTRVIVIGADNLSCDWANRKVAINYRQTGDATGDIVSLELK